MMYPPQLRPHASLAAQSLDAAYPDSQSLLIGEEHKFASYGVLRLIE